MAGITRIVLHNSYFNGKTVALECDGHTHNFGGNAAGKTCALNLIPFFYGEEPEKLVAHGSDKFGFADFYLPEPSSLIIFEYPRKDGPCCVVAYRSRSGGVAYRFIKGSVNIIFFSTDTKEKLETALPASELFDILKAKGMDVSRQISTVIDYRAIIQQNDLLLRRNGKGRQNYRAEARRFCLGGADTKMSHIDKLTFSILKRKNMFSRFKNMVAETMFDINIEEKPQHLKNEDLLDDISSLRDFMEHESQFREAIDAFKEHLHIEKAIHKAGRSLKACLKKNEAILNQKNEDRQQHYNKENKAKLAYEIEHEKLTQLHTEADSKKENADRWIAGLHADKQEWNSQNITDKQMDYNDLEMLRDHRDRAERDYQQAKSEVANFELQRSESINEANSQNIALEGKIQQTIHAIEADKNKAEQACNNRTKQIENKFNMELTEVLKEATVKDQELVCQIARFQAAAESIQPTDEERIELTSIDEKLSKKENDVSAGAKSYAEAQKDTDSKKEILDNILDKHNYLKKILDQIEKEKTNIQIQLFPADNTLLAQLRNSDSKWGYTIGKVINPRLLFNTNLSPEMISEDNTLFGWELNLDKIELPKSAQSEDYLLSELKHWDNQYRTHGEDLENHKSTCAEASDNYKVAYGRLNKMAFAFEQRKAELKEMQELRKDLIKQQQRDQMKRREDANIHAKELSHQLDQYRIESKEQCECIQRKCRDTVQEERTHLAMQHTEMHKKIKHYQSMLAEHKKEHQQRLELIAKQFKKRCLKQGVDSSEIDAANKKCKELKEKINTVNGYSDIIIQYKSWKRREWSQLEKWKKDLSTYTKKESSLQKKLDELQKQRDAERKEAHKKDEYFRKEISRISTENINAKTCLNEIGLIGEGENTDYENIVSLIKKIDGLIVQKKSLQTIIQETVAKAQDIITTHRQSQIYKEWEILQNARKTSTDQTSHSIAYRLQLPQDLQHLLEVSLPQIKTSLVESIRSVGNIMSNYYLSLRHLTTQVKTVSNKLEHSINEYQIIEDLSNIRVILTSRVEEEECWALLLEFHNEWTIWNASLRNENIIRDLPPESLIRTLRNAIETLKTARISKEVDPLIDMHITMLENGRPLTIRSDNDLDTPSSNGLSYLAICIIFMGMSRYLCKDSSVHIVWSIDELASLSLENIAKLFDMLNKQNIVMFSACPELNLNLLKFFTHQNMIDRTVGVRIIDTKTNSNVNHLKSTLLVNTTNAPLKNTDIGEVIDDI